MLIVTGGVDGGAETDRRRPWSEVLRHRHTAEQQDPECCNAENLFHLSPPLEPGANVAQVGRMVNELRLNFCRIISGQIKRGKTRGYRLQGKSFPIEG